MGTSTKPPATKGAKRTVVAIIGGTRASGEHFEAGDKLDGVDAAELASLVDNGIIDAEGGAE